MNRDLADDGRSTGHRVGRVQWTGYSQKKPGDAQKHDPKSSDGPTKKEIAESVLRAELATGDWVRSTQIEGVATGEGVGRTTLQEVANDLGVIRRKGSDLQLQPPQAVFWYLPASLTSGDPAGETL